MAYTDLREFIRALEKAGELKRISFEVDPLLEITEFADRAVKRGGPALLFEKPKGSRGSGPDQRLRLRRAGWRSRSTSIRSLRWPRASPRYLEMRMPQGLIGKLKMLPKLAEMASFFPKMVGQGAVPGSDPERRLLAARNYPSCSAGPRTAGRSSPCRWCSRATRTPASATAACTACRSTTSAPPACTGRRTSRAPSTTAAWRRKAKSAADGRGGGASAPTRPPCTPPSCRCRPIWTR